MRKETDSLGEVSIPINKMWGTSTQRSLNYFNIGREKMPLEIVYALAYIKKACARANNYLDLISDEKYKLIADICDEIINKKHDEHFPLSTWLGGATTALNMNINEVIANIASHKKNFEIGSKKPLHPNDDVNLGQSTNDVIPSANNLCTFLLLKKKLVPALKKLEENFYKKGQEFSDVITVGRTHLMDAVPMTIGQMFFSFHSSIHEILENLEISIKRLLYMPLGGTAVGTGLNAHKNFSQKAISELSNLLQENFMESKNKFHDIAFVDQIVSISSNLKHLAISLIKITSDINFLASGPSAGINELILPANEPGSSIMPGKINPSQLEILKIVSMQVLGNDKSISLGALLGNLQLNVNKSLIIHNMIQSITILSDAIENFCLYCLKDIKVNQKKIT